ncbi:NADPH-ferrihemoprotein reductase [Rhizoctonia solani AG-1 IB]|uniref:NADPH-ferrihemoprotein reductase n=1 Tax=Thanatephorus cucumeris (strain AG1-IB / isolate 7/3/14) TaxID=1108050 RepID=A0A0B7FXD3_THACB|nr:NADPH-ferrihemoprotein reductase [Rhizoctonia solani AG-1 IB]
MTTPIPRPPGLPIIGNLTSIDADVPTDSLKRLAKEYGEIYHLRVMNEKFVCIGSVALAQEVLDEKRFHKVIDDVLKDIRKIGGDGLFTAYHNEPAWGVAHRILMPAFGPLSIKNMFDDMVDVVSQLVLKWERFGPRHEIDPAEEFSKLAFDTIALCTFNYRLNSFYSEGEPPFVKAMMDFLFECNLRTRRPAFVNSLPLKMNTKFKTDIKTMNKLASQIVQERKQNPIDKKDLLNAMLNGRDPQTGQGLSDENIQYQMLTFLIAGHETTSGMLSFVMMHVLRHPEVYAKIRKEVDTVLGKEKIKFEHLSQLTYISAVLKESLRLTPSIGEFIVASDEDQVIGNGKYLIKKGTTVALLVHTIGRDPTVWGDDVENFKPERMLDGKFEALPPKAWIPFGSGTRACIGRPFSWQEALIALATIFQKFDFVPVDPAYKLRIKQTITLKPQAFKFRAIARNDAPSFSVIAPVHLSASASTTPTLTSDNIEKGIPLYVFYGSNSGSCEGFAQTIASKAAGQGFHARIDTLDSAVNNIPTDGPVVIVTASFEGEPADNAGHFVKALTALDDSKDLGDVSFAVFGAGNHEWAQTYQRIPKLIDAVLEKRGAKRLLALGEGDAGGNNFLESFNEWEENLWTVLAKEYNIETKGSFNVPKLDLDFVGGPTDRATILRQPDSRLGLVAENKTLTAAGAPAKHHIEFELPDGMTYQAGDYLAILPLNPPEYIRRVLARFKVSSEQEVLLKASGPTTLPTGRPVGISEVLSGFVEIGQVATKRSISTLLEHALNPATRVDLEAMLQSYNVKEGNPQVTMLDLLEKYPDIDLPLGTFIASLPTMRLRQYSISSSPLWNPSRVTVTFGVINHGQFFGVASNYLANLRKGDRVQMVVRPSAKAFHPPPDPKVPMVLFAAGSGIAPFRGFLQERATQAQAGRQVEKSLLFFGCRTPNEDYLYANEELAEWRKLGVVEVRPAFSRAPELSGRNKYVQHRIWADRALVKEYFDKGAKFYTCGGSHIAAGIRESFIRIVGEHFGEQPAEEVFKKIQSERYATDVFG